MKPRNWLALAASLVLALAIAACGSDNKSSSASSTTGSSAPAGKVSGAGSTFAAPIYQEVGSRLNGQGITVNYQSIGSGAGVAQFTAGTVDFGASDPPMKDEEIAAAKKKGDPVHIPTAFGAITVSYNLQGVAKGLKLDGATVADMFLGKVKKWNDPAIKKLNPSVNLPDKAITVVHRSDESGTTKGFTDFLQSYSPEWKSKVGSDKTVKWPTGTGAKGNEGVAAAVKQQEGTVGYVEEAYALQNNFTTASVKNKAGSFIEPTLESTTAAGQGVTVPADLRFTVINSPEAKAYPIASQTFVIVWQDACKAGKDKATAQRLQSFLDYMLKDGQSVLGQLQYAKLPAPILQKAQAKVDGLECNGTALKG